MKIGESQVKDMLVREVVSAVNRCRKAADLVSSDSIRVFYDGEQTTDLKNRTVFLKAVADQKNYVSETLKAPVCLTSERQVHMHAIANDTMDVFGYQISVSIAKESISFASDDILKKVFKNGTQRQVDALKCYVGSIPYLEMNFEEKFSCTVDGESVALTPNEHFFPI